MAGCMAATGTDAFENKSSAHLFASYLQPTI